MDSTATSATDNTLSKKYGIVVSDFDGTLLRSDDTVSADTVATIKAFIQNGGLFMIATGRMYDGIHNRLADVGLDKYDFPLIAYQGSLARTAVTGKELFRATIDRKTSSEILAFAEEKGLFTQIYINGRIKTAALAEPSLSYARYMGAGLDAVGRLSEYILRADGEPEKILCILADKNSREVIKVFAERFGGRVKLMSSTGTFVEAVPLNSGKDVAVERVLRAYGKTMDDIIACGDNLNDLDMVRRAGLGVAVANAEPEVKAAAKFITKSNDEDGVAYVIKKFCL
ncbi:MAG: Cof-type HAD-IIB family hydrolase [Clostridiales bacterium]|nr:Cof-type HAD-IIB family hydrolase [Clostridiales bacterium]